VVLALQRNAEGAGPYGSLILDTRAILSGVRSWVIQHVGRDGNMAAHHLAKLLVSSQLNHVWVDSFRLCLSGIVNSELFDY
jgi:hypothetical protein